MVHNHEDLKRALEESSAEYRKLIDDHQTCESRLEQLQGKAVLDEAERVETVDIKKQKLQIKDRMELMLREFIERESGAGVRR